MSLDVGRPENAVEKLRFRRCRWAYTGVLKGQQALCSLFALLFVLQYFQVIPTYIRFYGDVIILG